MNKDELNRLSGRIIKIGVRVHKKLGPGFTEKIYEKAMEHELEKEGIKFKKQAVIKVRYGDLLLGNQRVDFLVEDEIIVELKAVFMLVKVHEAQMISYLKSADKRLGLILNFATGILGIKRVVNKF